MFNLEINDFETEGFLNINIIIDINNSKIRLIPEHIEMFADSQFANNPHMDTTFDSSPSDGKFIITLDDNFSIEVAKYGGRHGGSVSFTTERTHEISIQFSEIVGRISDAVKEFKYLDEKNNV